MTTAQVPGADRPSHLQQVQADLVSELLVPDEQGGMHHAMPVLNTAADYDAYIRRRTSRWIGSRKLRAAR